MIEDPHRIRVNAQGFGKKQETKAMYAVMMEFSGGAVRFPFRDQPTKKEAKAKLEYLVDADLKEMGLSRKEVSRLSKYSVAMPGAIVSVVDQTEEMAAEWKRIDDERYLGRMHDAETQKHYVEKHGEEGNGTVPDCLDCRVHLLNAMKAPSGDHWVSVGYGDGMLYHRGKGPQPDCAWCDLHRWHVERNMKWLEARA